MSSEYRLARPVCLAAILLLLAACQGTGSNEVVYSGAPVDVAPAPQPVPAGPDPFVRARILADILYDAKLAFDDNRLMTPAGNNAYDRYLEVLELDPGNAVALDGIQEIALRYIDLADIASSQGQYDNAASLLARGERVAPGRPELADARARLETARQTKVESFPLDPVELSSQSLQILNALAEIAQHIRREEATFIINARTDAEGRWIYKVMREAVGGYRLRGNIVIAGTPRILVTDQPG